MPKRDAISAREAWAPSDETEAGAAPLSEATACPWSLRTRLIASILVLLHITAIFWPPFTFASRGERGASPFAAAVMGWLRPYASLMFLDHGYFFFAPDPGPSHLVHYKVEFADGREPVEGVFPNLKEEQPRLLYHRHFMLAEALQDAFELPEAPKALPVPTGLRENERRQFEAEQREILSANMAVWQQRRQRYEAVRKSFEDHLLAKYGGSKVTITRRRHLILAPADFLRMGQRLDMPDSYVDLPEERLSEVIRP